MYYFGMSASPSLFELSHFHPGRYLRRLLDERGWTQDELAAVTGLSRQTVNNIIAGKSNVSPETAAKLAAALGNTPEEWIKWDGLFRLSMSETDVSEVERLARLYEAAPVRELQRRGWIAVTSDAVQLEEELTRFYGQNPTGEEIVLPIAAKRTMSSPKLTTAEKAWCFRAKQLANLLPIAPYDSSKLDLTEERLRKLAAFPKEIRHVSAVLAKCGIRFMIIEPLANSKIDGATFWIDDDPVIVMSLRHDRIDGFWFTLMHEFCHIRNGDASIDTELIDGVKGISVTLVEEDAERVANEGASNALIPRHELSSFINRVGPLYPRDRIVQFANRLKIHPGIVVGQLQHRGEIGYSALRPFLVKVRDVVISTALTDGYGQIVPEGI
jgi:HTH-type transcriptional regulator/antitoxin HigA